MSDLKHNFVHTNGIRLHYVEAGSRPLIERDIHAFLSLHAQ